jgi:endo-1,4-beta-mannosidase
MDLIERKGDKLYDGEKELRFVSINAPTLLDVTPWEQEDLIRSISQIGGRVTRTYTFSVNTVKEGSGSETGKFILGESNYNESALVRLDRLLEICNKCGIRIIIPFIDPYEYNGGIPAFNDFFGKKISEENSTIRNAAIFYEDTEIRNSFFRFVDTIVNRKNTVTGCLYKDDPAILAWKAEMNYHIIMKHLTCTTIGTKLGYRLSDDPIRTI